MFVRTLLASTALAASVALAAPAFAGECPAGQMRADATKPVNYGPKAVTDMVLAQIDLAGEQVALKGHLMRVRKLEIQPGGIVPWHSHGDRPALIYVQSGEIYEHASNCAVPILHKAGEVARETHATSHWWKNEGTAPVVLLSFDIQHDPNDHNM
jgi:quercetin dioxygenase-like cupin family protein